MLGSNYINGHIFDVKMWWEVFTYVSNTYRASTLGTHITDIGVPQDVGLIESCHLVTYKNNKTLVISSVSLL